MSKISVILVAAGEGLRFGAPKQFAPLGGRAVIEHSLKTFENHPEVDEIVLVLAGVEAGEGLKRRFPKISAVTAGGSRRQDSVRNGFLALSSGKGDLVLIHDAARPLIDAGTIDRVIRKTAESGAAIPVIPVEDTLKEVTEGTVSRTPDRSRLFRAQTPQGFRWEILKTALDVASAAGFEGTDESILVEMTGIDVAVVPGDARNIKITVLSDLKIAEALLED